MRWHKLTELFSYPLKQRSRQQFEMWADTVKVSESMKGLLSEALWNDLVKSDSGTPQLLLLVKKAMEWSQPGEDLNKLPRDFLL